MRREHAAELEHVKYKGTLVGKYAADLLVNEKVIVELKVTAEYNLKDEAQLLNQLKATEKKAGLLINFGKKKWNLNVLFIKNPRIIRVNPWLKEQ